MVNRFRSFDQITKIAYSKTCICIFVVEKKTTKIFKGCGHEIFDFRIEFHLIELIHKNKVNTKFCFRNFVVAFFFKNK